MTYDTAGRLLDDYQRFCLERGFPFERHRSLLSPDDTTLFCIAGMQRYKALFRDRSHQGTVCNVQRCLRLDDLSELGDGHHWLSFDMLGMFSFRQLKLEQVVELWWEWLHRTGIHPDTVTVHPDRLEWSALHRDQGPRVQVDEGCTWSDGDITGYCTEFYVDGLEIGNIVNPGGDCIDVGFGLDRLGFVLGDPAPQPEQALRETVLQLLQCGILPGNKRQSYVLRRLMRQMVRQGIALDHPVYAREIERQRVIRERYQRLRERHPDQSPEWWWRTHGIDVSADVEP